MVTAVVCALRTTYSHGRQGEGRVGFSDLGQQGASRNCLTRIFRENSSLSNSYSGSALEWILEDFSTIPGRKLLF